MDDDAIIRKLFSRALKQLAPHWNVREAASGERALRLVEEAIAAEVAKGKAAKEAADQAGSDINNERKCDFDVRRTRMRKLETAANAI